jgi:hypothetical protein
MNEDSRNNQQGGGKHLFDINPRESSVKPALPIFGLRDSDVAGTPLCGLV